MSLSADYPADYRADEIRVITAALRAGECVSLIGLSGAGKSNLLTHLCRSQSGPSIRFLRIDGNRLHALTPDALLRLTHATMEETPVPETTGALAALEGALHRRMSDSTGSLCLAFDISMPFSRSPELAADPSLNANLRALRDEWKYRLTFLLATRRPLPSHTELSELCYAHTVWLRPLSEKDARWTVARFCERRQIQFEAKTVEALIAATRGYPSLLRAACEACADGAAPDPTGLGGHPTVQQRLEEFLADDPTQEEIRASGLDDLPLLTAAQNIVLDTDRLTAKELSLLEYLQAHSGAICAKDDLIRAVWPEDQIYERGVRDDSLAQLVRRLREKVEVDPSNPVRVLTVPGRGYRYPAGQSDVNVPAGKLSIRERNLPNINRSEDD